MSFELLEIPGKLIVPNGLLSTLIFDKLHICPDAIGAIPGRQYSLFFAVELGNIKFRGYIPIAQAEDNLFRLVCPDKWLTPSIIEQVSEANQHETMQQFIARIRADYPQMFPLCHE